MFYSVIQFPAQSNDDWSLAVVPNSWLFDCDTKVYWPPVTLYWKMVKNAKEPKTYWEQLEVEIMNEVDDFTSYSEAKNFMDNLLKSDSESDGKRKRRPIERFGEEGEGLPRVKKNRREDKTVRSQSSSYSRERGGGRNKLDLPAQSQPSSPSRSTRSRSSSPYRNSDAGVESPPILTPPPLSSTQGHRSGSGFGIKEARGSGSADRGSGSTADRGSGSTVDCRSGSTADSGSGSTADHGSGSTAHRGSGSTLDRRSGSKEASGSGSADRGSGSTADRGSGSKEAPGSKEARGSGSDAKNGFEEKVLKALEGIRRDLDFLKKKKKGLLKASEEFVPLKSVEDLQKLDNLCREPDKMDEQILLLMTEGGRGLGDITRNIMRKIAGVELWGNVAWAGQRGKVGLEKFKYVVNMIYGAVRNVHTDKVENAAIKDFILLFLKGQTQTLKKIQLKNHAQEDNHHELDNINDNYGDDDLFDD